METWRWYFKVPFGKIGPLGHNAVYQFKRRHIAADCVIFIVTSVRTKKKKIFKQSFKST